MKNLKLRLGIACATLIGYSQVFGQPIQLTLDQIIQRAKAHSMMSRQAAARKENLYWTYQQFKAENNLQLVLAGNTPNYSRDVISVTQPDGSIEFRARQQVNSSLSLSLEQPITWTGGRISMNSSLNLVNDLERATKNWNSVPMTIQISQPLFAYNSSRSNEKIERLRFEESKRNYAQELERISTIAVQSFFTMLTSQVNHEIAKFDLAHYDSIYEMHESRKAFGLIPDDQLLQIELLLLRSELSLSESRLELAASRFRLSALVGISEEFGNYDLATPYNIPEFEIEFDAALGKAKANQSLFIAFQRRKLEAQSEVFSAKKSRFQSNLNLSFGLNDSGNSFSSVYQDPLTQQRFNLTFRVPILDWGRQSARVKMAVADMELSQNLMAREEIDFGGQILVKVNELQELRKQVAFARKAQEIADRRFSLLKQRFIGGKTDVTNLNIGLSEKNNATRTLLGKLYLFWLSYYEIRMLTLFDFHSNQLLYDATDN